MAEIRIISPAPRSVSLIAVPWGPRWGLPSAAQRGHSGPHTQHRPRQETLTPQHEIINWYHLGTNAASYPTFIATHCSKIKINGRDERLLVELIISTPEFQIESKESRVQRRLSQGVQGQGCLICPLHKALNILQPLILKKKEKPLILLLRLPAKAGLQRCKMKLQDSCYFWGCFSRTHSFWDTTGARGQVCRALGVSGCAHRRLWCLHKVQQVPWHFGERLQKPPGVLVCINVFVLQLKVLQDFWSGGSGRFVMHFWPEQTPFFPSTQCVWEALGDGWVEKFSVSTELQTAHLD